MKKRAAVIFTVFLLGSTDIFSQQVDTLIQSIINQTNPDSLTHYVNLLSGEEECVLPDTTFTIISRSHSHPDNEMAANYIKYQFESFGLNVFEQSYSSTGKNIYAVQQGAVFPDKQFIICAHYDDMPTSPPAPGADDDASGVAAVLEAARIFSSLNPDYTIIYAAWDEEEIGLYGSAFYAGQAFNNGDDIQGVLNLEMFGWDGDEDGKIDIHTDNIGNSPQLADSLVSVNATYNIGLNPVVYNPGTTSSDHSSFWQYGYGAVVFSEAFWGGDFNPYYHTSSDKIEYFNLSYFHKLSKLAVGTLASLSLGSTIVNTEFEEEIELTFYLYQNYPNPFNPTTRIKFQIPELSFVYIKVYDVLGSEIVILVSEEKPAGSYELTWSAASLPSGIYFYRLQAVPTGRQAGDFIKTKKMVLLR